MGKEGLIILILLNCLIGNFFSAQDAEAFNRVYKRTFLDTRSKTPNEAFRIADSLYHISKTPYFQAKSLMLTATLYEQQSQLEKSILFAEKAEKTLSGTTEYEWQSRIYGFMASQYRMLQLYGKSGEYAQKAIKINSQIKDPVQRNMTMGMMLQEMAYSKIALKKYQDAITYIKKSQVFFTNGNADLDYFTGANKQLLGLCYYSLGKYDLAIDTYKKALKDLSSEPEDHISALAYNGLAATYLKKNNFRLSKTFLIKAQRIADTSQYPQLQREVYETARNFYAKTGKSKAYDSLSKKLENVNDKINQRNSSFLNNSFTNIEKKSISGEAESKNKNLFIVGSIFFFLAIITYMIIRNRLQKKEFERFRRKYSSAVKHPSTENTIISSDHQKNIKYTTPIEATKTGGSQTYETERSCMMTTETEQRLLKKLDDFENSHMFLQSTMSLSFLSTEFETNTKYLSYVVNTYRNKDFNNYINSLRIRYIIQKLSSTPIYRQYKISALAEECGFSSQAKFSTIFKNETSFSPSSFIKYLEEDNHHTTIKKYVS